MDSVTVVTQMIVDTQQAVFLIMEKMSNTLDSLSVVPTLKDRDALRSVYEEFRNDKNNLMHRIQVLRDVRDELNKMSKATTDGKLAD